MLMNDTQLEAAMHAAIRGHWEDCLETIRSAPPESASSHAFADFLRFVDLAQKAVADAAGARSELVKKLSLMCRARGIRLE